MIPRDHISVEKEWDSSSNISGDIYRLKDNKSNSRYKNRDNNKKKERMNERKKETLYQHYQ
jgi:hypothetical protein